MFLKFTNLDRYLRTIRYRSCDQFGTSYLLGDRYYKQQQLVYIFIIIINLFLCIIFFLK